MEVDSCISVIFDLSLRHTEEGKRIVDVVKDNVREFVQENFNTGEDVFYLYHPELVETLYNRGEQVAAISNYETDGGKFNIEYALKQCLYVMAVEDIDLKKAVFVVSDRITEDYQRGFNKFLKLNEMDDVECDLHVIGIGDKIQFPEDSTVVSSIEKPEELKDLMKELLYG